MGERKAHDTDRKRQRMCGMRSRILLWRSLWLGFAVILAGGSCAKAQITTISNGSQLPHPEVIGSMPDPNSGPRSSDPALRQERIYEMNILRHQEVVSDTKKLLQLTAELNAQLAQSHAEYLTRNQLRMLAKIEKLAKTVREDMTASIQGWGFD